MTDCFSGETRRYCMSRVRSANTRPEEKVRKYLFAHGFRYRKNVRSLPGAPDIVLPKYRTVIFVNGCFWHMHDCGVFKWPKSNVDFWTGKIYRNVDRDRRNAALLEESGWRVIVVWECRLRKKVFEETMEDLVREIRGVAWKGSGGDCGVLEAAEPDFGYECGV